MDPISDLETIEVLREIIDQLPPNSLLKRYVGDVYYDLQNLKSLFGLLKKDNITPEEIETKIQEAKKEALLDESYYYKKNTAIINRAI